MAKDDREIIHAIRMPKTDDSPRVTYKAGMEDELAAALTQEQLDAFVEAGDLKGKWVAQKGEGKAAKKGK